MLTRGGDVVNVYDVPTLQVGGGKRREYNIPELVRLVELIGRAAVWVVEHQSPRPESPVVSFKVGLGYGVWLGVLSALSRPHMVVLPQTWQKAMYAGAHGEGKDRSILVAGRLFPNVRLARHDWADALLIAEWGRRELWGTG